MQKPPEKRRVWSTQEVLCLALNLILGGFFALSLVQSEGGDPLQIVLLALLGFFCGGAFLALLLQRPATKLAAWLQGATSLILLGLAGTLAYRLLTSGDRFALPFGLMVVVALLGFAGLLGWLARLLVKME